MKNTKNINVGNEEELFIIKMQFTNVSEDDFAYLASELDKDIINASLRNLQNCAKPTSDYKFGKVNGKFWAGFMVGKLSTKKRIIEFFTKEIYVNNDIKTYCLFLHTTIYYSFIEKEYSEEIMIDKDKFIESIRQNKNKRLVNIIEKIYGCETTDIVNEDVVDEQEQKDLEKTNEKKESNTKSSKEINIDSIKEKLSKEYEKKLSRETKDLTNKLNKLEKENNDLKINLNQVIQKNIILENDNKIIEEEKNDLLEEKVNLNNALNKVNYLFSSLDIEVSYDKIYKQLTENYSSTLVDEIETKISDALYDLENIKNNPEILVEIYVLLKLMEK